jgi:hypothetical protein
MVQPRSSRARSAIVPVIATSFVCGAIGCGNGDPNPGHVPAPTRDYGRTAYGFVTQQSNGQLTQLVLHSDGRHAVLLILKDGAVDRAQTTRLVGDVIDPATIQITEGQVNVDADDTFTNNDVVPADGYVLVTGDEIASEHVVVGSVFKLTFDFRAIYNGPEDVADLAPLLVPG